MESKTDTFLKRKEAYAKRMLFFQQNPTLTKCLHIVNKAMTYSVFLLYPLLLLWIWGNAAEELYAAIVVPLDSFILLSVARYFINRKRPYEVYDIPSAIHKHTYGKSFPSRHVFSAFVIAMTFICKGPNPMVGVALLFVGGILGVLRVVLGVHFTSDVLVGAMVGILAGIVGYIII